MKANILMVSGLLLLYVASALFGLEQDTITSNLLAGGLALSGFGVLCLAANEGQKVNQKEADKWEFNDEDFK